MATASALAEVLHPARPEGGIEAGEEAPEAGVVEGGELRQGWGFQLRALAEIGLLRRLGENTRWMEAATTAKTAKTTLNTLRSLPNHSNPGSPNPARRQANID